METPRAEQTDKNNICKKQIIAGVGEKVEQNAANKIISVMPPQMFWFEEASEPDFFFFYNLDIGI